MAQMQEGLAAWRTTGAAVFQPYGLALLAKASTQVGQPEAGLTLLAEALAMAHDKGECRWEAELYRLQGELLLVRSAEHQTEAEACFCQALDIARRQQAKSWELRAAISLHACGSARASTRQPRSCWHPSTAGSLRALILLTCRRPRRC